MNTMNLVNSAQKMGGGGASYSSVRSAFDRRKRSVNPFVLIAFAVIAAFTVLSVSCNSPDEALEDADPNNKPSGTNTVTFDPTGGNWDSSTAAIVKETDQNNRVKVPAEPKKSGFNFAGWHLTEDINASEFTSSSVVKESMTVYAVWESEVKVVTFYTKNAEGENTELGKKYVAGTVKTVSSFETPLRENFAFCGWYLSEQEDILIANKEEAEEGVDVEFSRDVPLDGQFLLGSTEVSGSTDVYALWQEQPEHSVMVTFEAYEDKFVKNVFLLMYHDWKMATGSTLPPTGSRDHYNAVQADHWFMEGGEEFTTSTELSEEGGNIVVRGKWEGKTYTATFHTKTNGADATQTISRQYPQNTIAELPAGGNWTDFSNDGKWYTEENAGTIFTSSTVLVDDIDLYAHWTRVGGFKVTFNGNGNDSGSPPIPAESTANNAFFVSLPITPPKKNGNLFLGWQTEADGGAAFTSSSTVSANITVYAKWYAVPSGWTYVAATNSMYKNYTYAANAQSFTAPEGGSYSFELWGGGGGNSIQTSGTLNPTGGKGGYIKAAKIFTKNETLYIYTGQRGADGKVSNGTTPGGATTTSYGGGGSGGSGNVHASLTEALSGGAAGGGATFVSTAQVTGTDNSGARAGGVLFAGGGGGGASSAFNGGWGSGTDIAGSSGFASNGGSARLGAANANGIGSNGRNASASTQGGTNGAGGGGGGYKGGAASTTTGAGTDAGGGGGSGYVSTGDGWTANSRLGGNEPMPNTTIGGSSMTGNSGNGAVRVTYTP